MYRRMDGNHVTPRHKHRYFMWFTTLCISISLIPSAIAFDSVLHGCVFENIAAPIFFAVGYTSEAYTDHTICVNNCFKFGFDAAAIDNATHCLCGAQQDVIGAALTAGECDTTCTDGTDCGGDELGHFTVWFMEAPLSSLDVTVTGLTTPYIIPTEQAITIEVANTTEFSVLWGDGSFNADNTATHTYMVPGTMIIEVFLTKYPDVMEFIPVTVVSSPNFEITCPLAFELNVPSSCLVLKLEQGYNFTFDYSIASDFEKVSMSGILPGTQYSLSGSTVDHINTPSAVTSSVPPADQVIFSLEDAMRSDGYLTAVEVILSTGSTDASLEIMAIEPSCPSGVYCKGLCTDACDSTCSGVPFCSLHGYCKSCTTSAPSGYTLTSLTTAAIANPGSQTPAYFVVDPPLEVKQGWYIGFKNLAGSEIWTQFDNITGLQKGDLSLTAADTTIQSFTQHRYSVRYLAERHPKVRVLSDFTCTVPAAVPVPDVPTPYSVATEIYANLSTINVSLTVTNQFGSTLSHTEYAKCQVNITDVTNVDEIWIPYDSGQTIALTFSQGSSMVMSADIDGTLYYNYHDHAQGGYTWHLPLLYPFEGVYHLTGTAFNALSSVNFTSIIHVVPNITDTWTLSAACLCVDWDSGYTINLDFPSAAHPPWNATIYINSTVIKPDGSVVTVVINAGEFADFATFDGQATGKATGTAASIPWSSTIVSIAGNHTVRAYLSNEVSNTWVEATWEVAEAIRNVSATITWINFGQELPGTGPNGDTYIVNRSTIIYPTTRTGEPTQWKLRINETGVEYTLNHEPYATNYFNITFPDEGDFTLIVSAYNDVQGWIESPPIPITVVNKIANFDLVDDLIVVDINETKEVLATYDILTPISCLIINWGDNSPTESYGDWSRCNVTHSDAIYKGTLTNPYTLTHAYAAEGAYTVSGLAFDMYLELRDQITVVVGDLPCNFPNISIVDQVFYPFQARQLYRLMAAIEEGVMQPPECEGDTPLILRSWSVLKIDPLTQLPLEGIDLKSFTNTWNSSQLNIPSHNLDIGHYKITYEVTFFLKFNLTRDTHTYLEIIRSPLVGAIINGSITALTRGFSQNLLLQPGSLSYDPDEPDVPVGVLWFCRQLQPIAETHAVDSEGFPIGGPVLQDIPPSMAALDLPGQGCFGDREGQLNLNETDYYFDMSTFKLPDAKFMITAVIFKDTRRVLTQIELTITHKPPPHVQITCKSAAQCHPYNGAQLINPSINHGLDGSCIELCHDVLDYSWVLYDKNGNKLNLDNGCPMVTDSGGALVASTTPPSCTPTIKTTLTDSSLLMTPELYALNPNLVDDTIVIRLSITTGDGRTGFSEISLQLNKPPELGGCTMTFNDSFSVMSRYDILCNNWQDPENLGIESYTYYYYKTSADGSKTKQILASTRKNSLPAILPVGVHTIYVDVRDVLGAYTTVELGTVQSLTPSKEELLKYDPEAYIKLFTDTGDQTMATMMLNAYQSVLQNSSWFSLDPENTANMTEAEINKLLMDLANFTSQNIAALKSQSPATLSQLIGNAQTLENMLALTSLTELGAYGHPLNTRYDVLEIMQQMTDDLDALDVSTPQEMEPFLKSSLSVITSEMKSCNVLIGNNDKAPPWEMQCCATYLEYDAGLPPDILNPSEFEVPTDPDEILTQNVLESAYDTCKYTTKELRNLLTDLTDTMLSKMTKGESIGTLTDTGSEILLMKSGEEKLVLGLLLKSTEFSKSSVYYPKNFCPSRQFDPYTKCRVPIGFSTVIWPVITDFYTKTVAHLSEDTRVIQAEVSLNDVKVPVENQPKDIIFQIPRTKLRDNMTSTHVNVSSDMCTHVPVVYHFYKVPIPDASLNLIFTPSGNADKMIIIIDHSRFPLPRVGQYWKILKIKNYQSKNGTYNIFIDNNQYENKTGKFIAAVGMLKSDANPDDEISPNMLERSFPNYNLNAYLSACYFFNTTSEIWSASGLKVDTAEIMYTKCATPHLTGFGSGFLPAPNTIDFDFINANFGLIDNSTLYAVLIVLLVIYILMMIWAHYTDRKDLMRLGVIPLPDNKLEDKYVYEMTFFTGPDSESTCESKISIMLSGEYGETPVRLLPDPTLNLYRRYDRNSFVMTCPKPLGPIHYLRVFHDNSGRPPYASWQLERAVVRDLQKAESYNFEINSWLSFDRDDCLIDRTFTCADHNEEESDFSTQMYSRVNRKTNQDHMWLSIFLRPRGSRYSRKERVTVAFVFLYLSMLCNAMYHQVSEDSPIDAVAYIGLIPITSTLIMTGILVLLFVYPFCFLLGMAFKRARPRKLRRCRALEAIEKQKQEQSNNSQDSLGAILYKEGTERSKEKPVVRCIPWWVRYLAWILCFVAMCASIFIVFMYGIKWGNIKTIKWFSSFFISFFLSLLISQWIKVACIALCSTIAKPSMSIEDVDCDEELPHLKHDEKWRHTESLDAMNVRDVHKVEGVDITERKNKRLRNMLKKQREMKYVLRGVLAYCFFLLVIMIIVADRTDKNAFLLKQHMENIFITPPDRISEIDAKLVSTDDFWHWTREIVIPELRAQVYYNGAQPLGLRGFIGDKTNRIIGYAILRQNRVSRFSCGIIKPMDSYIKECSGSRGLEFEDDRDYCADWRSESSFPGSCHIEEFRYRNASVLETLTTIGRLGTYGGGGYVFRLKGKQSDILNRLNYLQKQHWVDRRTRAVFIEFSLYNANVNLFTLCSLIVEFMDGGGTSVKWGFSAVKLLDISSSFSSQVVNICKCLFLIGIGFFTINELWNMKKQKCSYFSSYWNITELTLLLVSYTAIGLHFYKSYLTSQALQVFNKTKGNAYVRMDPAITVDQFYIYLVGFIMFFSFIKLIKLLQFNKRMDILALTIRRCWDELSYFFIAFAVIFFAFCALFYFMFLTSLSEFSRLIGAILMCFSMMLGKFEFSRMREANELSPILFFVFSVLNSMILINIMLTIILQAFNEIKLELKEKANKYDLLDFMWASLKKFTRMQPNPVHQVDPKLNNKRSEWDDLGNEPDELPVKVDALMDYINMTYFGGKMKDKDFLKKVYLDKRGHGFSTRGVIIGSD